MRVPTLRRISQNTMSGLIDMVIPQEMKDQGVQMFVQLSRDYGPREFEVCITNDVSIWSELLDEQTKRFMKQAEGNRLAMSMTAVLSEDLIADWVVQARPELTNVFLYRQARNWLGRQIDEMRRELSL